MRAVPQDGKCRTEAVICGAMACSVRNLFCDIVLLMPMLKQIVGYLKGQCGVGQRFGVPSRRRLHRQSTAYG